MTQNATPGTPRLTARIQERLLSEVATERGLIGREPPPGPGAAAPIWIGAPDPRHSTHSWSIVTDLAPGTVIPEGQWLTVNWQLTDKAAAKAATFAKSKSKSWSKTPVRGHYTVHVGDTSRRRNRPEPAKATLADGTVTTDPTMLPPNLVDTTIDPDPQLARRITHAAEHADRAYERLTLTVQPITAKIIRTVGNPNPAMYDDYELSNVLWELAEKQIAKFFSGQDRPNSNLVQALSTGPRRDFQRLKSNAYNGIPEWVFKFQGFIRSIDADWTVTDPIYYVEQYLSPDNTERAYHIRMAQGRDAVIRTLEDHTIEEIEKLERKFEEAIELMQVCATPQSLNHTIGDAPGSTLEVADVIADDGPTVEESAISNVEPEQAVTTLARKWFHGSGLTEEEMVWSAQTLRFITEAKSANMLVAEQREAFVNHPHSDKMTYVLLPLVNTDERLDNDTHLNKVIARLRDILMDETDGVLRPRDKTEIKQRWHDAIIDSGTYSRTDTAVFEANPTLGARRQTELIELRHDD